MPRKPVEPGSVIQLDVVTTDPNNARKRTEKNRNAIKASLEKFAAGRSIVLDKDNVVRAGNGTVEMAKELGYTEIVVVEPKPGQLVAVRRPEWTAQEAKAYAIADNRTAELAEWDDEVLAEQLEELQRVDLSEVAGFSDRELEKLLNELANKHLAGAEEDDAGELPEKATTRHGDLWRLGDHVVMCGDSTSAEQVTILLATFGHKPAIMVTDPPYGVEYEPGKRSENRTGKVLNDDRCNWQAAWELFPGDVAYVWHAAWFTAEVLDSLRKAKLTVRNQIIWAKNIHTIGRGAYHWRHEPCWYAVRDGAKANWCGDRKQTTLWEINMLNRRTDNGEPTTTHGCQKPVECMARPMRHHGRPGEAVYDPFLGSGTSIIAAVQTERLCCGMELDPRYVDMIVQRWQRYTGLIAVNAITGEPYEAAGNPDIRKING